MENKDQIITIPEVMSIEECEHYIQWSEQQGYEAAPFGHMKGKSVRNNDRLIHDDTTLAEKLWQRISEVTPCNFFGKQPLKLNERFRFYRYQKSQRFAPHRDGKVILDDTESFFTFIVYLNCNFTGGQTKFPKHKHKVSPTVGMGLLFPHNFLHESTPIVEGVKYALRSDVMYAKT